MKDENFQKIKKGSKSFFFASLFLSPKIREDAWILYRWCREADDEADDPKISVEKKMLLLQKREAFSFEEGSEFKKFLEKTKMPSQYPKDLIEGMKMDLVGFQIHTQKDLEKYSYHVAGCVGVMMCFVMGVRNEKAYPHAISLGLAMQMTNICRDVKEDFENGRCYLPKEYLKEKGLDPLQAGYFLNRLLDLYEVVKKVLRNAEVHYENARAGLVYLPYRERFSIMLALRVYERIGLKILKKGPEAILERTYTSFFEKCFLLIKTFFEWLRLLPHKI